MVVALLEWLALETGATSEDFDAVSDLAVHLLGFEKATSWAKLGQALASIRSDAPGVLDDGNRQEPELVHSALEILLWVAVCATENKMEHIQLIFQMDDDNAAELKEVVQDQQSKVQFLQQHTQEEEAATPNDEDASRLAKKAPAANNMAEQHNLEEEVSNLRLQVQAGEKREAELITQLREAKKSSLDDEMRAIERQKENGEYSTSIEKQRQLVVDLKAQLDSKDARIIELSDRLDVSADNEQKLSATVVQLGKCRGKIEELQGVKEQLCLEQEARAGHVEKVLALEAEVAHMPALKKQVEDYKQRLAASTSEIRELKKELERRGKMTDEIMAQQRNLTKETEVHQEHSRALQQELAASQGDLPSSAGMGMGTTELSPELTEKMARLERDNESLRACVDKSGLESIVAMENDLDDAKRLVATFEEKLDQTEDKLASAEADIARLQMDLARVTAAEHSVRKELSDANSQHAELEAALRNTMKENEGRAAKCAEVAAAQCAAFGWLQRQVLASTRSHLEAALAEAQARGEELEGCLREEKQKVKEGLAMIESLEAAAEAQEKATVTAETAMKEAMVACEDAKKEALSSKDQELAAFVASHQEAMASLEGAKATALSAKDAELASYMQEHKLSNKEHAAHVAAKDRETSAVLFQLKESEEAVSELENRIRKLTREKKFLKDELDEAVASGGGGNSGDSKMLFSELQSLQKEYCDLSDRYRASQLSGPSSGGASVNEASSERLTRHSSRNLGDTVAVYERRAMKLDDEKRELLMKCTAAVAGREQSLQTVKLLTKELSDAKERATALELEKERALRQFHRIARSTPQAQTPPKGPSSTGKENAPPNVEAREYDAPQEQCNQS